MGDVPIDLSPVLGKLKASKLCTNGTMNCCDLSFLLERLNPDVFNKDKIELIFGSGSGRVDLESFIRWVSRATDDKNYVIDCDEAAAEAAAEVAELVSDSVDTDKLERVLKKAKDEFKVLDRNRNGTLSPSELEGLAEWVFSEFGRQFKSADAKKKAIRQQTDRFAKHMPGGGEVSFDVFCEYYRDQLDAAEKYALKRNEAYEKGYNKTVAAAKFKELDVDNSGQLEGKEIVAFAEWVHDAFRPGGKPMTEKQKHAEANKLLKRLDENKGNADGKFSFAEFDFYFNGKIQQIETMKMNIGEKVRKAQAVEEAAAEAAELVVEALEQAAIEKVMAKAKDKFQVLDRNHNGSLSGKELEGLAAFVFSEFGRQFKSEDDKKTAVQKQVQRFAKHEPDGGEWTFEVFSEYYRSQLDAIEKYALKRNEAYAEGYNKTAAAAKFKELDRNNSGQLEGKEIVAFVEWVHNSFRPGGEKMTKEQKQKEAAKLLKRVDENKGNADGKFSFAEFDFYFDEKIQQIEAMKKRLEQKGKKA